MTSTPNSHSSDFLRRHIGPDASEMDRILKTIGVESLTELADSAFPAVIVDEVDSEGLAAGGSNDKWNKKAFVIFAYYF